MYKERECNQNGNESRHPQHNTLGTDNVYQRAVSPEYVEWEGRDYSGRAHNSPRVQAINMGVEGVLESVTKMVSTLDRRVKRLERMMDKLELKVDKMDLMSWWESGREV